MDAQPATETWPVLVMLPEEIDMTNANEVRDQLAGAMRPGVTTVIADMTATTFCDSMGARALLQAYKLFAANDTELRLLSPCPAVLRVVDLLGLDRLLPIYGSRTEALMP